MLAGSQGSKGITCHMGLSVWDQLKLPRHSLLEPRQETSGHKNKLGIVKPKATHHRRLSLMPWRMGGLEQSQQRRLSQTGCCCQSWAQQLPAMCNTQNKAALMENLPFDSALHRLACLGTQLCAVSDGQLSVSMPSGFMCLWERGSLDSSLRSASVGR